MKLTINGKEIKDRKIKALALITVLPIVWIVVMVCIGIIIPFVLVIILPLSLLMILLSIPLAGLGLLAKNKK